MLLVLLNAGYTMIHMAIICSLIASYAAIRCFWCVSRPWQGIKVKDHLHRFGVLFLRRKQGCNEIGKCCPFFGEKCQLTSLSTKFPFISPWNVGVLGAFTTAATWPLFKFADDLPGPKQLQLRGFPVDLWRDFVCWRLSMKPSWPMVGLL